IDPLSSKFAALAEEQLLVAQQEQQKSAAAFEKGKLRSIILMVICLLMSGFFALIIVRRLLLDLGAEPSALRKIAEAVANGDLSITIQVDEVNRSDVLWAFKVMVENLREILSQNSENLEYIEHIIDTVREPMLVLHTDLKVISVNSSFYSTFKVKPEETIGKFIYDLGNKQWDIPTLQLFLEEIVPANSVFNNYEVDHVFQGIGRKTMLLNARQIFRKSIGSNIILLAMKDITEQKQAEEERLESESRFKGAFDYSAIGMALVSTEGKWLKVNISLCQMLGYSEEELLAKTFQVITVDFRIVWP
ncbi:MAG: PAS domain S-box protein, partial [Deltaproteobacteria bacterium]